jgi:hypothetical protein
MGFMDGDESGLGTWDITGNVCAIAVSLRSVTGEWGVVIPCSAGAKILARLETGIIAVPSVLVTSVESVAFNESSLSILIRDSNFGARLFIVTFNVVSGTASVSFLPLPQTVGDFLCSFTAPHTLVCSELFIFPSHS